MNGTSKFTSVTTWNHSHFDHFDADKIIQNMMNSKNWPTNKYYGMTVDEIKGAWDKKIAMKLQPQAPKCILILNVITIRLM